MAKLRREHRCCVCGSTRRALVRHRPKDSPESAWLCSQHVQPGTVEYSMMMTLLTTADPDPVVPNPDSKRRWFVVGFPASGTEKRS